MPSWRSSLNACPETIRVLGVDPGTLKIGVGILEVSGRQTPHVLFGKTIHLKGVTTSERLHYSFQFLTALVEKYRPHVLVTEKAFLHKNVRSSLLLGQSRGVIMLVAEQLGLQLVEFAPTKVKKSVVGRGHATKLLMQNIVARRLGLKEEPTEDAADALALALCYSQLVGGRQHDRLSLR